MTRRNGHLVGWLLAASLSELHKASVLFISGTSTVSNELILLGLKDLWKKVSFIRKQPGEPVNQTARAATASVK
jgi:hypothetical protein